MQRTHLIDLPSLGQNAGEIHAIVETPRGSRNKYKYDPDNQVIRYDKALPAGTVFPQDFGFVPSTLGEDGDPLDVMVFLAEAVYPGILVLARLIGAIEAEQTEKGKTKRNDRLIAVATRCPDFDTVRTLDDLNANIVTEIEHFFVSYNEMEGKQFKSIGRANAEQAMRLIKEGQRRFKSRPTADK